MFVDQPLALPGLLNIQYVPEDVLPANNILLKLLTDPEQPGLFYKHLCHWLTNWLSHPLWKHLQGTFHPKPWEQGSWNFQTIFTSNYVSHITCHKSCVMCHMSCVTCNLAQVTCSHVTCHFFFTIGGASRGRVCYQQGLPGLVYVHL